MTDVHSSAKTSGLAPNCKDTAAKELPIAWSAQQAHEWRQTQRLLPIAWLVAAQFALGAVWALTAYMGFGMVAAMSVGYGALCAALPSAILARGMRSSLFGANPIAAFMLWELVKMALGVAMLVAAPKLLGAINWLALLAGLILTLKVVFLTALWPHCVAGQSKAGINKT